MKIAVCIAIVGACLAMTEANKMTYAIEEPAVCKTLIPLVPIKDAKKSVTENAGDNFQPELNVADQNLHPTAVVDCNGKVTTGNVTQKHKIDNVRQVDCGGYPHRSQVYGRSMWFDRVWAMMFVWHFPLAKHPFAVFPSVIVWTNNPNVTDPIIEGVSTSTSTPGQYTSQVPFHDGKVHGKTVKVSYSNGVIVSSSASGEKQPLILWHQMPVAAQKAFNDEKNFHDVPVPFNDKNFYNYLNNAFPWVKTPPPK